MVRTEFEISTKNLTHSFNPEAIVFKLMQILNIEGFSANNPVSGHAERAQSIQLGEDVI